MYFAPLITTERLLIKPLSANDNSFIMELVNTEEWIKFIGNRNVTTPVQADAYIQKILTGENIFYWVVLLEETRQPVGVITFIKRNYLQHHDIGFAFLPRFFGKGYAYEAAAAVLNSIVSTNILTQILATTIPQNKSSIRLLEKLGLSYQKQIAVENEMLHVYGAAINELKL